MEPGTGVNALIDQLDAVTGGLSHEGETCLREMYAELDLGVPVGSVADLFGEFGGDLGDLSDVDFGALFVPGLVILCLSDEDAAAVSLADVVDDPGFDAIDISVAQFRCIYERDDAEEISAAMSALDAERQDPGAALALSQALSECGIDLPGLLEDLADIPTPVPTPPVGVVWRDIASELSTGEVECLRGEMGGASYESLLDQPVFGGVLVMDLPLRCFEQETIIETLIGRLNAVTGGLSGGSEACLRERFASVDLGMLQDAADTSDGFSEDLAAALGPLISLAHCLADEEANVVFLADITGNPSLAVSVAQIVCVDERAGLAEFFAGTIAQDPNAAQALFQALSECGIDLARVAGGGGFP